MSDPRNISISDFDYVLPHDSIPHFPEERRDGSRLLIYRHGEMKDVRFEQIADYLPNDTLLVFNNTRVIRARLNFLTEDHKPVEIFCLEPAGDEEIAAAMNARRSARFNCLVGNLRRWKQGHLGLNIGDRTLTAEITDRRSDYVEVSFSWTPPHLSFAEILQSFGSMPIPPYLQRKEEGIDNERYQTVYAQQEGSVAAPTAGLHFTQAVLDRLKAQGVESAYVTLHVGAGTFKPVKTEKLGDHEMHAEWMDVGVETLSQLSQAHEKSIIAVGTTSFRTMESLYWMGVKVINDPLVGLRDLQLGQWEVYGMASDVPAVQAFTALHLWMQRNKRSRLVCKTRILIAPPYTPRTCAGLITNFHQPKSTLLLLVAAFTGGRWRDIYEYAARRGFRFLSYGDSSLLLK